MNILQLDQPCARNLGNLIRLQAQQVPDQPCYIVDERVYTFAEVNSSVNRYAAGLRGLGVGKGDRVVIFMRSCVEYIFVALATNKLGALWVPVNGDYKGLWLAEAIADSKGKVLVTDTDKLPRVHEAMSHEQPGLEQCGKVVVKVLEGAGQPAGTVALSSFDSLPDAEPQDPGIDYGDTFAILWTSGTTGKAKGVLQPHNAWINCAEVIHGAFGTRPDDVVYNCLPLYNTGAWVTAIIRALYAGIPCALDEVFSASHFWQRIHFYKATETTTLGAMHMYLWNAPETPDDAKNTLRNANVIPLPPKLVQPFMQRFGIEKIQKGYGQSEASSIMICIEDGHKAWKPNCLGNVSPGLELTIRDDEGKECPPGTPGEFCIHPLKPYLLFSGYFENGEATRNAWMTTADGKQWYRTGDLGMRDGDGDFYFLDRKKDFIRLKGRNVSSLQVEAQVMMHPAVAAVACFGVPSDDLESESEIKIDVVLKPGQHVSAAELARYVNDNAPYFFVPRYIEFVDSLPYTPTNKVQKFLLREKGLQGNVWDRLKAGFALSK